MKRVLRAVKELLSVVFKERPMVVVLCTGVALFAGVMSPLTVWVNGKIIDLGLLVASGKMTFMTYLPYLIFLCACFLIPSILNTLLQTYIYPTCELVIRTIYKGKMLQKLKKIKYEHMESKESIEIIEKAYTRAEEAAIHLFPSYYYRFLSSIFSIGGMLYLFCSLRWWLSLTILIPFALDTYLKTKNNFNIYDEMETYWNREHQYTVLGNMLKSRDYLSEAYLLQASTYLVDTYEDRLHKRNREFEHFYFCNLRKHFAGQNISKIAQIINALLLLYLYINGELVIGQLIAMTMAVFSSLWQSLDQFGGIVKWIGHHVKTYQYYDMFFSLSEDEYGNIDEMPQEASIEFRNVSFTYPGTKKQVLNQVSFVIKNGEKVALVGKNGEGKTTIIKLLLGLFQPDSGEILIGGIPLQDYTQKVRERLCGAVFQDFTKFDLTLNENIGIGNIDSIDSSADIQRALRKAKIDKFINTLPDGGDTLLGRNFDGGVDISGGQWQRIAIGRAFMGDKPIMVLDEPTSQIDPMTESEIYADFAEMSFGRTTLFVTHRLGATTIVDRILVLSDGSVIQSGSHDELMRSGGIYADMFKSQQQWYNQKTGGTDDE